MDKFLCVVLVGFFCCVYSEVTITEMKVPQAISLNDTIDYVDFDCNFATNESGIEVKWFHNSMIDLIYQWVPGYNNTGTGSGVLKDRLDPKYKVTNNTDTEYRGFRITKIGPELTGNYTCKISGDFTDALDTRQMIIYSPPQSGLDLILLHSDGVVICSVSGISPMPEVDIYILNENGTRTDVNEEVKSDNDGNGIYNLTVSHDFTEYNHTLLRPTKFVCNLSIPGTPYVLTKEVVYPGNEEQALTNETYVTNVTDATTATNDTTSEIVSTTPRDSAAALLPSVIALLLTMLLLVFK